MSWKVFNVDRASPSVPLWKSVLLGGFAGGLGWGIRGQYGHETGAMMAGLLVSLAMVFLFCSGAPSLPVARAAAWGTIAMGFGGSMTYGQTVGLTHDAPLVGHWEALRWGMLGLAIKGGLWIGFAGTFLGMGLGGKRYRPAEMLGMMLGVLALCALGIRVLNEPFDPEQRLLPRIYFSDDWRWEPDAVLKPRREVWGGFLAALVGLFAYLHWVRRDGLATRLGLWGVLGGALGFPLGQSLQAAHAWNPGFFSQGIGATLDPVMNWWNFMETTFGATMGAMLGLGLWIHRARIAFPGADDGPELPAPVEWVLLALHLSLLVVVEFFDVRFVNQLYDFGLGLGLIPMVAVAGGRWWPWMLLLPVTLLPIAGKTLQNLAYEQHRVSPELGWALYVAAPLGLAALAAVWLSRRDPREPAGLWTGPLLLGCTWLYFGLNFAFFQFPWPWNAWTIRTPNALVFLVCVLGLSSAVVGRYRGRRMPETLVESFES
ncbi:MAG: hypothetical protein KIT22_05265 [Verrucomicrobiae bacterium]|nr:hypothetical protein [Verrucomicrobiae bacterium]